MVEPSDTATSRCTGARRRNGAARSMSRVALGAGDASVPPGVGAEGVPAVRTDVQADPRSARPIAADHRRAFRIRVRAVIGAGQSTGASTKSRASGGPGSLRPRGTSEVGGSVPDAADRLDQRLVLGAELGPEPADVHVDRPGAPVELVSPDLAQERGAREHPARPRGEEPEQLELLVREV